VRDRDRLRKEHLERLGWHVHRLWSTAWFTDPGGELTKLRAAFDTAVRAAPPAPPPADAPAPERPQAGGPEPDPNPAGEPEPAPQPAGEAGGSPATASGPPAAARPGTQPPPRSQGPGPQADEYWPLPRDAVRSVRAIPLGPGERPALSTPAPKALPVSAGAVAGGAVSAGTGPAALPAAPAQDDKEPAD
jgi:hypothetical protein